MKKCMYITAVRIAVYLYSFNRKQYDCSLVLCWLAGWWPSYIEIWLLDAHRTCLHIHTLESHLIYHKWNTFKSTHTQTLCAFFSPMVCHFFRSQEFIVIVHYEDHNQGRRKISLYLPIVFFLLSFFLSFSFFRHLHMISILFTKWMGVCVRVCVCLCVYISRHQFVWRWILWR